MYDKCLLLLSSQLSRLQNDLLVGRKTLPGKERLEAELVAAQIELKEENTRLSSLERAVECASDPARLRLLPGNNPTLDDLREKIEAMEVSLFTNESLITGVPPRALFTGAYPLPGTTGRERAAATGERAAS